VKKQDILALLVTFIVGIVVGFYLYFTGFLPQYGSGRVYENRVAFELRGEVYGGCSRDGVCGSFIVREDGSYRAFPSVRFGEERLPREGTLPREMRRALLAAATKEELSSQSAARVARECPSAVGGLDFRIRLTRDDITYTLDTCTTAVNHQSELWRSIYRVLDAFRLN
jgi:hypothetical protein